MGAGCSTSSPSATLSTTPTAVKGKENAAVTPANTNNTTNANVGVAPVDSGVNERKVQPPENVGAASTFEMDLPPPPLPPDNEELADYIDSHGRRKYSHRPSVDLPAIRRLSQIQLQQATTRYSTHPSRQSVSQTFASSSTSDPDQSPTILQESLTPDHHPYQHQHRPSVHVQSSPPSHHSDRMVTSSSSPSLPSTLSSGPSKYLLANSSLPSPNAAAGITLSPLLNPAVASIGARKSTNSPKLSLASLDRHSFTSPTLGPTGLISTPLSQPSASPSSTSQQSGLGSPISTNDFALALSPSMRAQQSRSTANSRLGKRGTWTPGLAPANPTNNNLHLYPDLESFGLGMTHLGGGGGGADNISVAPSTPSLVPLQLAPLQLAPSTPIPTNNGSGPNISPINLTRSSSSNHLLTSPNHSSKRYSYGPNASASSNPTTIALAATLASLSVAGMTPSGQRPSLSTQLGSPQIGARNSLPSQLSPTSPVVASNPLPIQRAYANNRFRIGGSPTLHPTQGRLSATGLNLGAANTNNQAQLGFSPQRNLSLLHTHTASPKSSPSVNAASPVSEVDAASVVPLELPPAIGASTALTSPILTSTGRPRSMSNAAKRYSLQGLALNSVTGLTMGPPMLQRGTSSTNLDTGINGGVLGSSIFSPTSDRMDVHRTARGGYGLSISPTKGFHSPLGLGQRSSPISSDGSLSPLANGTQSPTAQQFGVATPNSTTAASTPLAFPPPLGHTASISSSVLYSSAESSVLFTSNRSSTSVTSPPPRTLQHSNSHSTSFPSIQGKHKSNTSDPELIRVGSIGEVVPID